LKLEPDLDTEPEKLSNNRACITTVLYTIKYPISVPMNMPNAKTQ